MPNEPQAAPKPSSGGQAPNEPVVIPLEDPTATATPKITADAAGQQGAPQGAPQAPSNPNAQEGRQETPEEYWKRVALEAREDAEQFRQYRPLINHLEKNPSHVDVLQSAVEGHAIGIIAADNMAAAANQSPGASSPEDALSRELGFDDGSQGQAPQAPPAPQPHQPSYEEAMAMGAERERAKMEFLRFREDMIEKGVPDHAIDEFVQFLRKPDGLTLHDLYVAFGSYRERVGGGITPENPGGTSTQHPAPVSPRVVGKPMSVTSMPAGQSDRPDSNAYVAEGENTRFVQDPANI